MLMLGCASLFALWLAFGRYENTQPTKWESIYRAGDKQTVEVKSLMSLLKKETRLNSNVKWMLLS